MCLTRLIILWLVLLISGGSAVAFAQDPSCGVEPFG